jgi:hypothetical protein
MPVLVVGANKQIRMREADKPFKATPGERVLWFGCKDACSRDAPDKAPAERFAETPRPLV